MKPVAIVASGLLASAALITASAAGGYAAAKLSTPTDVQTVYANCKWTDPNAKVLCVGRAPNADCPIALRAPAPCWWFTGSDTQIVFNWSGKVANS